MRNTFIFLIMIFISSLSALEINWAKDYKSGVTEALKFNKPIFFVSSRHTCRYCVMLEKTAFIDKKVIQELNKNFINIISYSDENDYMPKELWQPGTPALWFLKPSSEPMFQPIMGALSAKDLLNAIDIVKKEHKTLEGKNNK